MSKKKASLVCRPFEADEWETLRALRLEALRDNPRFFGRTYAEEKDLKENYWRDTASSQDCTVFGLFIGEDAIGMLGIATMRDDPSGKSAVLWGTYVKPDYRGHGLTRPLYQTAIAYAKACHDWSKLIVSHRDGNEASKHATLVHGFRYTGDKDKAWHDGGDEAEVMYELAV